MYKVTINFINHGVALAICMLKIFLFGFLSLRSWIACIQKYLFCTQIYRKCWAEKHGPFSAASYGLGFYS